MNLPRIERLFYGKQRGRECYIMKKIILQAGAWAGTAAMSFLITGLICHGIGKAGDGGEPGREYAAGIPAYAVSADIYEDEAKSGNEFTIKTYYGNVGIFYGDSEKPLYVTDIETGSMRQGDRDMFDKGIVLESYDEVLRMLEDFNS